MSVTIVSNNSSGQAMWTVRIERGQVEVVAPG